MDMFKADIDCDPEDARFERLDGTDGSAEIKQFVLYLKHLTAIHMAFCFEKKRKKKMVCCHN